MDLYFDRQGNPLPDVQSLARLFGDDDYRQVALTELGNIRISTVWLGINFDPTRVPLIFETMVFGGPLDRKRRLYPTEAAAIAGHDQVVAEVRDAIAL